jgi:hypothetical protein
MKSDLPTMRIETQLTRFGSVPLTHGTLLSVLQKYRSPNDKIAQLIADGLIVSVKRGLYVVAPSLTSSAVSMPLVANHLYGPSYVSLEYGLYYHGLIPERVVEVTSVTTRQTKLYDLPFGRFSYKHSPLKLYPVGIKRVILSDQIGFLIASPEKALCDTLIFKKKLVINSVHELREYLFDDVRIDEELLRGFDVQVIDACRDACCKVKILNTLAQIVRNYQE